MTHAFYIPREIWGLKLSVIHRCVLSHIQYYTKKNNFCDSSNPYLARIMACSENKISKTIKELKEMGYIEVNLKTGATSLWEEEQGVFSHRKMACIPLEEFEEITRDLGN